MRRIRAHRALQVHRGAALQRCRGRRRESFPGTRRRCTPSASRGDHSETDAVDGQGVPGRQIRRQPRGQAEAEAAGGRLDLRDLPQRLDQSGEHLLYPALDQHVLASHRARRSRSPSQANRSLAEPRHPLGPEGRRGDVDVDLDRRRRLPRPPGGAPRPLRAGRTTGPCRAAREAPLSISSAAGLRMTAPAASSPATRSGAAAQRARCVTIMTGPASSVESTRAVGGVRSRRSKMTRVSGRSR